MVHLTSLIDSFLYAMIIPPFGLPLFLFSISAAIKSTFYFFSFFLISLTLFSTINVSVSPMISNSFMYFQHSFFMFKRPLTFQKIILGFCRFFRACSFFTFFWVFTDLYRCVHCCFFGLTKPFLVPLVPKSTSIHCF